MDNCYYISLYNIHSNLILFKREPDFYLDVYLLKYKFINKIVLKAGRHLSIDPKNRLLVETNDSHESDYNNMCFNFLIMRFIFILIVQIIFLQCAKKHVKNP